MSPQLRRVLAPVRRQLLVARLLQLLASAATVVPYAAIAELARRTLATGGVTGAQVSTAIVVVVGALVVRALAGNGAYAVSHLADARLQQLLRAQLVGRLGAVPLGWFTRTPSAVVRKVIHDDVAAVHALVAHGSVEAVAAVATPAAALGYLVVLDPLLALAAATLVPAHIALRRRQLVGLDERLAEMGMAMARLGSATVELVDGITAVKLFRRGAATHERYRLAATEFGRGYAGWVGPLTRRSATVSALFSTPTVLALMLGVGLCVNRFGSADAVDVVVAAFVAATIPPAFVAAATAGQNRREAEAAAAAIVAVLDLAALPAAAVPRLPVERTVRFEAVHFSYDDGHEVTTGVDLTVPAGTLTALVGPSGAGKSTLATLLARFADPTAGRITIGDVDLRDIDPAELASRVGVVLQDAQLLALSVGDNIRLGRPQASDADVRAAARAAGIEAEIDDLPRGFESVVGDDARLSGGQAQRVTIARAILGDPDVVVLDEATAFADVAAEAAVQRALAPLLHGRTVLVIAHRLATIVNADQIAVVEGGRIVARGRHAELLAAGGIYAAMWAELDETAAEQP